MSVILNGWKEIANQLGRGVRTVQRWEQLGLPVRRPKGSNRSAVLALSEEVDEWVRGCAMHRQKSGPSYCQTEIADLAARLKRTTELVVLVCAQRSKLCDRAAEMRSRIEELQRRYGRNGRRSPLASLAAAAGEASPSQAGKPPAC
jgi:hypothetical protein